MSRNLTTILFFVSCAACSSVVAVQSESSNDEGSAIDEGSVSDEGISPADEGTPPADEGTSPADEGSATDKGPEPISCEYEGVVYQVGESWDASDGCNWCYCNPEGGIGCTLMLCPPTDECTEVCGDLNGDGVVGGEDHLAIAAIVGGNEGILGEECADTNGDVLKDGALTEADVYIIAAMVEGLVTLACESCELLAALDRPCGDVNGDGIVDVLDMTTVANLLLTMRRPNPDIPGMVFVTGCTFWAIDVDGNGTIEVPDYDLLTLMVLSGEEGSCAPVAGSGNDGPVETPEAPDAD